MIGEKLGPYEILESIGSGGMGEVWKAKDTRLSRIVAIKKVKEQHSERFKQEARSIAALNHPNICQIFDIGDDYLVLEYVEGNSLSSPLPEQEAVRLAIQIATALEEAHQHGIIHRDLKPSNIMVTDKGSVKLLDFGLAKLYEQDQSNSNLPTVDFPATQAGAILGTVAYMSPEQAQGQPADARSDIFSFGLVLYEMLSGRRAFTGDSTPETLAALLRDEPDPLKTSPALEKLVNRCLEKKPLQRYQRMSELKVDLVKATAKVTVSSPKTQPSIAVLPFADMSPGKDNEWFSDGLAEEIINALTKIPDLKVIARTSAFAFKGKEQDIRRIAEALDVSNILEGSVRKAGDRIRITAQLIKAKDGSHLWSERYDREMIDVFAIQDEIASAITAALKTKLSSESTMRQRYEPKPEAYEAYLKARYLWGKLQPELVSRSQKYLEQAIALDPRFALAHCGLADHFLLLGSLGYMPAQEAMSRVREEAQNAMETEPSMPEAHAMLGIVACICDYDWKEAAMRFDLAMNYDPVPIRVRQWYGFHYLLSIGRVEESLKQIELVVQKDPLNIIQHAVLGSILWSIQRIDEAQTELKKCFEFETPDPLTMAFLALTYVHQENLKEAFQIAEKASLMAPSAIGVLAGVLKRMGKVSQADELIQSLMSGDPYGIPLGLSFFHITCEEIDKAAECWEKVIEQRHPMAPMWGSCFFRSTSYWPTLARLMNLPHETQ
jgi:serine/threonine protein kinase/tetratricopeptide (TPR) repeat protein